MAVQSNSSVATSAVSSGTCGFSSPNTAGNTIVLFVGGSSFSVVAPTSVFDSNGNIYTLLQSHTGETGGYANNWMYVAFNVAGGANTITVDMSGNCNYQYLTIVAVEEAASSGVRVSNINYQVFTGVNPSVTLAGVVANDIIVSLGQCDDSPGNTDYLLLGAYGYGSSVVATLLQQLYLNSNSTGYTSITQDGVVPAGSGTFTMTNGGTDPATWTMLAVALIPGSTPTPPVPATTCGDTTFAAGW